MTLHMLHLPILPRALMACARAHGHVDDHRAADLGYLVHGLFARLGASSPKPFDIQADWRRPPRDAVSGTPPISVLAYAPYDHDAFHAAARAGGDGLACDAIAWECARSKNVPGFAAGQTLGFRVRVCPTVRIGKRHPRLEPGAEVDPYHALLERGLGERLRAAPDADGPALRREVEAGLPDRELVYRDWLAGRVAGAAELVSARLVSQRDATLWRRGEPGSEAARTMHGRERPEHRGRRRIGRREAVFEGALLVADASAFAALLARGVGRHRAFGFGMLLLRPSC